MNVSNFGVAGTSILCSSWFRYCRVGDGYFQRRLEAVLQLLSPSGSADRSAAPADRVSALDLRRLCQSVHSLLLWTHDRLPSRQLYLACFDQEDEASGWECVAP